MTPVKTGYAKEYGLLVVEGEISDLTEERIIILETNIDDVSGEIIGYAVEKFLAAGAVDVFVTQGFGKKTPAGICFIRDHDSRKVPKSRGDFNGRDWNSWRADQGRTTDRCGPCQELISV